MRMLLNTLHAYLIIPSLVLGFTVRAWPGAPRQRWARSLIGGLLIAFCAVLVTGILFAQFTAPTETKLPDGVVQISRAIPLPLQIFLEITIVALFPVSLYGAWTLIATEYTRHSAAIASGGEAAATARRRMTRIFGGFVVAGIAVVVAALFGGPLRMTMEAGNEVNEIWPFVLQMAMVAIFIIALGVSFNAAKAVPAKP